MNTMPEEIAEYFSQYTGSALKRLHIIRNLVLELLPEAGEKMKYGIPTFIYNGNLVHYAAFKKHIGFYPVPSGIEAFKDELSPYKQGKGSIQLPLDEELPVELIRKIVLFRIEENKKKKS